jgi:hypothetical protein
MHSLKRSIVLSLSSALLLAGALIPALASAASSSDGSLRVYVDVDDSYRNHNDSPSDFTVRVYGDDVSKTSFRGSSNGTTVRVDGWYSVYISDPDGYTPSYSSGCNGDLGRRDSETCRITLRDRYDYNNYYPGNYNYQYPAQQYYAQPCSCQQNYSYYTQNCGCQLQQPTLISTYIPGLPNTGFEPINTAALALMFATLAVGLLFAFPYVRKTLAVVLR